MPCRGTDSDSMDLLIIRKRIYDENQTIFV